MHVDDLPDDVRAAIGARDVVVFDGVCVLCTGFFRFLLRHDRAERLFFATAQDRVGQALFAAMGLPTDHFETYLVIHQGRIYQKAQAFGAVMAALGGPWRVLGVMRYVPHSATGWAYDLIARNRYRLFGRRETCFLPDAHIRSRFLT